MYYSDLNYETSTIKVQTFLEKGHFGATVYVTSKIPEPMYFALDPEISTHISDDYGNVLQYVQTTKENMEKAERGFKVAPFETTTCSTNGDICLIRTQEAKTDVDMSDGFFEGVFARQLFTAIAWLDFCKAYGECEHPDRLDKTRAELVALSKISFTGYTAKKKTATATNRYSCSASLC